MRAVSSHQIIRSIKLRYVVIIALLSLSGLGFDVSAVDSYGLKILPFPGTKLAEELPYVENFPDSLSRHQAVQAYLSDLYSMGYLAASFDSLHYDTVRLTAYLDQGKVYEWAQIDASEVDEGVLSRIGFRAKLYHNKFFNHLQLQGLQESILEYYENNGHPFAVVRLDDVKFDNEKISASLIVNTNRLYLIDSIEIVGDANISPIYLHSYLGIKTGDVYNERLIGEISSRIKELSFLRERKPAQVRFTDKSATLLLNLTGKKASRFTGMIGFLPKSKATSKLIVTGEAQLKLLNSFGRGELIHFDWRSLQPRTQDLNVNFVYPFVLSTPFGADLKFKLYKRDTLYLDLYSTAALQYLLRGGNSLKAYVHNKETRILSTGSAVSIYANVKSTLYGMGYTVRKLDYALNPRKGIAASIEGGAGTKRIQNDDDINPDSVDTRSTEYEGIATIDGYIPLSGRNVLRLGLAGGYRSSKSMFVNELYRLGGLATLRGFDEESIFASSYGTYIIEYRYLLEQNSFVYVFFNGAYYENEINRLKNESWVDAPYGYGAGISFETKAGIFSINYAIGQQQGNPPDLKAARVHFGIVSSF